MANIGSVFLGDSKRFRNMASSTPPTSPPATMLISQHTGQSAASGLLPSPVLTSPKRADIEEDGRPRTTIEPGMSLELRLRWLEAIVYGVKERKNADAKRKAPLARTAQQLHSQLNTIVEGNEPLKRFMNQYEKYAHYLTPAFALSGTLPDAPTYQNMSAEEFDVFLFEMEQDIRAADRDMREIEELEKKGVTGAGKLPEYEALQPRLDALVKSYEKNMEQAAGLERRVAGIMDRHATQVDALSELFVYWDEAITDSENKVTRLERDREERRRMGYE